MNQRLPRRPFLPRAPGRREAEVRAASRLRGDLMVPPASPTLGEPSPVRPAPGHRDSRGGRPTPVPAPALPISVNPVRWGRPQVTKP